MTEKRTKKGRPEKAVKASKVLPPVKQKVACQRAAKDAGMSLSAWLKHAAYMISDDQNQEEY